MLEPITSPRIWIFLTLFLTGVTSFSITTRTTCKASHRAKIMQPNSKSPFSSAIFPTTNARSDSALFAAAKKKKKKKTTGPSFGGFGGAAMESCPCGSGETYSKCCSKVHKDVQNFRKASPEQIVRARYSAYSRKLPEFLMMSTHPNNKAFNPDLRAWKESIKLNMYDNFDLSNCVIVEEKYNEPTPVDDDDRDDGETLLETTETATVKFIAEMVLRETGEKTSFMETSTFEKAKNSGAWLYLSGEIEAAPGSDNESDGEEDVTVEEKLASQL